MRRLISLLVMYCLFSMLLIAAIGMATTSLLAGLAMLIAALLFLPPVNDWFTAKTGKPLTPAFRFLGLIGLIVLSNAALNAQLKQDNIDREVRAAADQKQQAEKEAQEQREYLAAHRPQILQEMQGKVANKDYQAAALLARKYQGLGDAEVDAIAKTVLDGEKSLLDQQRKASLVATLKTLKPQQYQELASTYRQLAALEPDNARYISEAKRLAQLVTDQEAIAKQKAAEHEARETQRNAGLLWNYVESDDSMTGKKIKFAVVDSTNSVDFGFPYNGSQRGKLSLRKHPRWGESAYVSLEKGQFVCGYDNCNLRVRYGEGAPQRLSASEPSDHSTNLLFITNHKQFIAQVRKVNKVYIEAEFYQEGNRVFEFNVSELSW